MNTSVSLGRPSLFQDVETVAYLKQEVLPVLLARVQEQPCELRLWLVGCGSGEDPYTLAMLLTDLLGNHPLAHTINIFATDEDETGLARARRGLYTAHQVAGVPRAYRDRFFVRLGNQYVIIPALRSRVIFGHHKLRACIPFPHLDLVVCLDGLPGYSSEEQREVFTRWAYALSARKGFLFLGRQATPTPSLDSLYICLSPAWRWYRPLEEHLRPDLLAGALAVPPSEKRIAHPWSSLSPSLALTTLNKAATFPDMNLPIGVVLLDRTYHLLACNQLARQFFTLPELLGEQSCDFLHSAQGLPYAQIRQAIDRAFQQQEALRLPEVEMRNLAEGQQRSLSLLLSPLVTGEEDAELLLLYAEDVTTVVSIRQELARAQATDALALQKQRREVAQLQEKVATLEAAHRVLLADYAHLAASVEQSLLLQEELAAFNEALQATNEELLMQIQARQELEHLNQLKDDFLSLASHELRTPLTVILGHAGLMERPLYPSSQEVESDPSRSIEQRQAESVRAIHAQATHLSRLIEQMVDAIRIREDVFAVQQTTPFDIVALVGRVVEQYQATSGNRLSYETQADTLLCPGDAGRIEQVCVNLMSNALKYSPSSSLVVVSVKREPGSTPVPQALIAVQDQGPGIRPEAQNEIFRRFYREPGEDQKHVEGLGLGLYVAHEIVMRHGGRLWVESTVGRGSTFYIALPLLEEIAY